MNGESFSRQRPIRQLPPDVVLFGREQDLSLLNKTVEPLGYGTRRASIAPLIGEPGVGKSALAISFAHSLVESYPDAQFYVDLRLNSEPVGQMDPAQVLRGFLRSLDKAPNEIPDDIADLSALFRNEMEGRRALILLDNAVSFKQIEALIPSSPTCHVIVTSQERLIDLQVPPMIVHELGMEAGIKLFLSLASIDPADICGPEDQATIREIIEYCDGLPLVIRVLAARFASYSSLSLRTVLSQLRENTELSAAFGPGREKITASFRISYGALSDVQAELFRNLSAIPGTSFEANLASRLIGSGGAELSPEQAAIALEDLCTLQLLQPTADERYFIMHSMLRRFAAENLAAVEGTTSRLKKLELVLNFYDQKCRIADGRLRPRARHVNTVTTTPRELRLDSREHALDWLSAERLNLVAAVKQACIDSYGEIASEICASLVAYFEIRGDWESWKTTHLAVEDALAPTGEQGLPKADISAGLGRLYRSLHQWGSAIHYYREAVALYRQLGRTSSVGTSLHALGDVYRYARSWDNATNCLQASRKLLDQAGAQAELAFVMRSLGAIHRLRGEYDEAEQIYLAAIELLRPEGDERWLAATRLSLADIYLDRGYPDARSMLHGCLDVFELYGDRHWRTLTLRSLGEAERLAGRETEAMTHLQNSLEGLQITADNLWEAEVQHSIGLVHLDCGRYDDALQCFTTSLTTFREAGDILWEGRSQASIGRTRLAMLKDPTDPSGRDALSRAWTLLVEQGANGDLQRLATIHPDLLADRPDDSSP